MTRYHVISHLSGSKFGDYGVESAANTRAAILNANTKHQTLGPVIGDPVYEVRRVETSRIPSASGELIPRCLGCGGTIKTCDC